MKVDKLKHENLPALLNKVESEMANHMPFSPVYGDVFCIKSPKVQSEPFETLVFKAIYGDPGAITKWLFKFRGWIGRVTGIDKGMDIPVNYPGSFTRPHPLKPGEKLWFFDIVHFNKSKNQEEVIFQAANKTVNAFFSMKRSNEFLYFITVLDPKNIIGKIYWNIIKYFHGNIIGEWLKKSIRP